VGASGQTGATGAAPVPPPANQVVAAQSFDVNAAVDAYLAKMPLAERARADAYFEGGYWLLLWGLSRHGDCDVCCCVSVGQRECATWPNVELMQIDLP